MTESFPEDRLLISAMAVSFRLTRFSSSVTRAFVSATSVSKAVTWALAAVRSAWSCSAVALPLSTWAFRSPTCAFAFSSSALAVSYSALAASRSFCNAAELFCSCVNWAIVEERDSLLAFSLLLNSSIAMIASTSSASSTICHTLPLEFITRPPCIYI